MLPGMDTKPTTDIIFKFGIIAASIADRIAGSMASFLVAPNASLVSDSCLLSATSARSRSTATAGPEIELPIIIPAVGTLSKKQYENLVNILDNMEKVIIKTCVKSNYECKRM